MSPLKRMATTALVLLLLLSACGGSDDLSPQALAAIDAAEANRAEIALTNDFTTSQMFDTSSGELVSLDEVVVGDRPVLLWYWAPN